MPSISTKGRQMPPSPIRKLVPFAEAAKQRGTKVIHLNIGQPDIATPEVALKAIRNLDRTVIEYSHSAGIESYRKGLAAYPKLSLTKAESGHPIWGPAFLEVKAESSRKKAK